MAYLKEHHAETPVVYFANGGSCYLHQQLDMRADSLAIDWRVSMQHARHVAGNERVLCGNVDPMILYAGDDNIKTAVRRCIEEAGGKHVLNLGHGVEKDTTEHAVATFVDTARAISVL